MIGSDEVDQLLQTLSAHPVLPPMDRLPPHTEALHVLLADLARGERSSHADRLRRATGKTGVAIEELARRAEFLLACLILPRSGSYYEMLGVAPDASLDEIRKRWAALIRRYHPDRLGGTAGWLDAQARQLIEAYQTLKDPDRRRQYDASLARERSAPYILSVPRRPPYNPRRSPRRWRRWRPLASMLIVLAGSVGGLLWYEAQPLPGGALQPTERVLEPVQVAATLPSSTPPEVDEAASAEPEIPPRPALPLTPAPPAAPVRQPSRDDETTTRPTASAPPAAAHRREPLSANVRVEAARRPSAPPIVSSAVQMFSPEPPAVKSPPPVAAAPEVTPAAPAAPKPEPAETASAYGRAAPPPAATAVRSQHSFMRTEPSRTATDPLALIETFRTAYERKDLNTLMQLLAAVPREQDQVGRSAVRALYASNFAALHQIRYELTQLAASPHADGNTQFVQGRFRIRAVRRDSLSQRVDVAGIIRWRLLQEADNLRIAEIQYEVTAP